MKSNRRHARSIFYAAFIGLCGFAFGLTVHRVTGSHGPVAADQPAVRSAYPLTIPAQRSRSYPGGAIVVEEELGTQPGYRLSRISYPSDGYDISGLMATPSSPRPLLGYPVIILAHGYVPQSKYRTNGPEYHDVIRAFARAGYVVIKPDFRGYGTSWGSPQSAYYSPVDNADIMNLAASLALFRPADASRVGLFGHSMGGHVALNAVTIAPNRFKAAVIVSAGVGEVGDMYFNWRPRSDTDNPQAVTERDRIVELFGSPEQNPRFWSTVSPHTYAKQLTTPIMLAHGTADAVIPARFTRQLSERLAASGHPAITDYYVAAGHIFTGADKARLIRSSLEMFDQYLKTGR